MKRSRSNAGGYIGLGAMILAGVAWFAKGFFNQDNQAPSVETYPSPYPGVVTVAGGGGGWTGPIAGTIQAVPSAPAPVTTFPISEYIASVGATREAVAVQQQALAYQAVDSNAQTQEQRQLGYDIVNKVIQPGLTSVDPAGHQAKIDYIIANPDVMNLLQQSAMFAQNQVLAQAVQAGQLAQIPEQSLAVSQASYDIARAMGIVV